VTNPINVDKSVNHTVFLLIFFCFWLRVVVSTYHNKTEVPRGFCYERRKPAILRPDLKRSLFQFMQKGKSFLITGA